MNEEPSLDPIFKQISELVNLAKEKSTQSLEGSLPPGIGQRLDVVQEMIEKFVKIVQDDLDSRGITDKELARRIVFEKKDYPVKARKELEKALSLGRDVLGLKYAIAVSKMTVEPDKGKEPQTEKEKKEQITKRKSKFKKLHGDQNWKKL